MRRSTVRSTSFSQMHATLAVLTVVVLLAVGVPAVSANPIVVTPGTTFGSAEDFAATLVATLIGANPGITVVGTPVYTGALGAAGLFTGGTGVLPFDAGALLTTGSAALVPGPNSGPFTGVDNGTPGDPLLEAIAGAATFNASLLTFSFIPAGNTISFQYVFGSDEYDESVGGAFNDTFAFLLNGVNIALIPGTSTPVSINTVNESANASYFANNNGGTLNIEYDGLAGASLLASLVASGAVIPGAVSTITLGIADAGDGFIDSGVMLASGTFATPAPVPEPGTLVLLGSGILALAARAQRSRRRG